MGMFNSTSHLSIFGFIISPFTLQSLSLANLKKSLSNLSSHNCVMSFFMKAKKQFLTGESCSCSGFCSHFLFIYKLSKFHRHELLGYNWLLLIWITFKVECQVHNLKMCQFMVSTISTKIIQKYKVIIKTRMKPSEFSDIRVKTVLLASYSSF